MDQASERRLEPFVVDVKQDVLDDLRSRLRATRFAPDLDNDDGAYGLKTAFPQPIVEYWADGFDWRRVEAELNAYTHHPVDVGGTPVHFIREQGKGPAPIPLLLLHGWPWTFWDWSKVIRPLADPAAFGGDPADAFDVIVPSLPGFGFSTPLTNSQENYASMAGRFHTLMTEILGHERFAVGASDYGALIGAAGAQVRRLALRPAHGPGDGASGLRGRPVLGPDRRSDGGRASAGTAGRHAHLRRDLRLPRRRAPARRPDAHARAERLTGRHARVGPQALEDVE